MLQGWRKIPAVGAVLAMALVAFFVITNVFADSNNPGPLITASYNGTTHTVAVSGHSNCNKGQPMGIAFFAVSKNPTTGAPQNFPIPDGTIDVLNVTTASPAGPGAFPLVNKDYSPGVATYTTNCLTTTTTTVNGVAVKGVDYTATLASCGSTTVTCGSAGSLNSRPDFICSVEYHIKGINGSSPNITPDGGLRDTDNSVETNGFSYSATANAFACFGLPPGNPTVTTDAGPTVQLGANGTDLVDNATLSPGSIDNGAPTGSITFDLYGPDPTPNSNTADDCTTSNHVGTQVSTAVNGYGQYASPSVHVTAAGKYNWIANFVPDNTNNVGTSNTCNATGENVTVINPVIDVIKTPASQSVVSGGTANFHIRVGNCSDATTATTCTNTAGDSALTSIVVTDPNATDCGRTAAQTLALIQAKYGNAATSLLPGQFIEYDCSKTNVTAAFLNVVTACGNSLTGSSVCDTDTVGGGPPGCPEPNRCGSVGLESLKSQQDFKPQDNATVTVTGGPAPNGQVTFALYRGDCTANNLLYQDLNVQVDANGKASTASSALLSALIAFRFGANDLAANGTAGTFKWQISYGGDTNGNAAFTGNCGDENFVITNGSFP